MLFKSIFFAVGVILLIAIMWILGLPEIISVISGANFTYILLALMIYVSILLLLGVRLKLISQIPYIAALRTVIVGLFFNFITPVMKIGGEPVKILLLKKYSNTSKATAIITMDTLVEIMSSFVFFFLILLFFAGKLPGYIFSAAIIFIIVSFALIAVFLKIFFDRNLVEKIVKWMIDKISRFKKIKDKNYAFDFYSSFSQLMKNKKLLVSTFTVSSFVRILEFVRLWIVFLALKTILPADTIFLGWVVILLLFMIPWLPGGLGLIEAGGAGVFIFLGVEKSIAASGILIERIITFWFIIFLGIILGATKLLEEKK